jgi:hypothetical protein
MRRRRSSALIPDIVARVAHELDEHVLEAGLAGLDADTLPCSQRFERGGEAFAVGADDSSI